MGQLRCIYHDVSAAGIIKHPFVVVVVRGNRRHPSALSQHQIPIGTVKACIALIDGVIVEDFQRPDAFGVDEFLRLHSGPDRMIVGRDTAAASQKIAEILRHPGSVPGSHIPVRLHPFHVMKDPVSGLLHHLLGSQNSMNVMNLQRPSGSRFAKDCRRLQTRKNDKIIPIKKLPIVCIQIVIGKAQKAVAMCFEQLHRLFRG